MKKIFSFLIIISMVFSSVFIIPTNTVHAQEPSDEILFNQYLDAVSVKDIKAYFDAQINELKAQRQQLTSDIQKKSIDDQIKGYSEIIKKIDSNAINEKSIENGKKLIRDHIKANSSSNNVGSITPQSIIGLTYDVVYASIIDTIVVGNTMGYTMAAKLLSESVINLTGSTYDIWNTDSIINNRVKASSYYQSELNSLRYDYKRSGNIYSFYKTYSFEFNGASGNIPENDMYYAFHGLSNTSSVSVNNGYGELILRDLYDFPGLAFPSNFSTALNDLGSVAISLGVCHAYNIRVHTVESFYNYVPVPYPGYYIKYGSTGSYVVQVQNRLNQLGFNCGSADGIFGNMTKNAVISFQRSRGLSADGIVGPVTWDYLFNK